MSYLFSKLKEQATSIQSLAKNMIVYENNEHDEDEDEEVLDQIDDDIGNAKPAKVSRKHTAVKD